MSAEHHRTSLEAGDVVIPPNSLWGRLPIAAAAVGALALVGGGVVGRDDLHHFFASYLVAFMFFLSIALGGLFFVLVHYASRAGWSVVVRRLAENVMATFPVLAILFVPIALRGLDELFHWAHFEHEVHAAAQISHEAEQAVLTSDPVLAGKLGYLNTSFFIARAVLYFVVWMGLAWYFRSRSVAQDETGEKRTTRRLQRASAPGLIAFALTLTFASFDWLMSLNPHWFSTIFGVYYFAGTVIAIFAFLSVAGILLRGSGLLDDVITREHYHDLGKMLFAFIVFWTYIGFSQYMLYWYANMPEETIWFELRWQGAYRGVTLLLGIGHFAVPFFFLMSRHIKRHTSTLLIGAMWMLFIHLVDIYWLVWPSFTEYGQTPALEVGLVDVLTFLGIGGLFIASFAWNLRRGAAVPLKDPRLPESLAFENF